MPDGGKDEGASGLPVALQIGQMRKQITPRSSSESLRSQDSWERDDDEDDEATKNEQSSASHWQREGQSEAQGRATLSTPFLEQSNPYGVKRKPIPASSSSPSTDLPASLAPSGPLGSRNPFRRNLSADLDSEYKNNLPQRIDKGKGRMPDTPPQVSANLTNTDRHLSEYSSSYTPSTIDLTQPQKDPNTSLRHADDPYRSVSSQPRPQQLSPLARNDQYTPRRAEKQEPLIPVLPEEDANQNPWSEVPQLQHQSSMKTDTDYASPTQLDDVYGGLGDAFPLAPPVLPPPPPPPAMDLPFRPAKVEEPSTQAYVTPAMSEEPQRRETSPASKASRRVLHLPSVSPAELERLHKQRSETYQIKHFNWLDPKTRALRRSSMLTQNQNGPCPLLALVNALILSSSEDSHSALGKSLANREQISLGLLIESLMDELTSEGRHRDVELPDVDDLNRFLLTLHTGLNANPKFAVPTAPVNLMDYRNSMLHLPTEGADSSSLESFEETSDIRLYGAFGIPLIHGWLPEYFHPASAAFSRSAQTYEDAQTIQFGEEELEARLSTNGLSPPEQQLLQDIVTIKDFFKAFPTQLTPYGLQLVHDKISPGSFAILFRNDHFSTIFKHPESGQIFTLVTDAGYATHDEVIWESLVDVSGQDNDLYSGDFRPVGNTTQNPANQQRESSAQEQIPDEVLGSPTSPTEQQEQADADFALALRLQDEEDQRAETERRNRASSGAQNQSSPNNNNNNNTNTNTNNTTTGNRRSSARPQPQQDIRPLIPPRNSRPNPNPRVNRPADADDGDAPPPSYDEAAKGEPYIPPDLNPHASGSMGRRPNLGTETHAWSPGSPVNPNSGGGGAGRRRTTSGAYPQDEHVARIQAQLGQPLGRPALVPGMNSAGPLAGQGRDARDRDGNCIVM